MAVAEPVEPPPPGYVSGAQAAAMARGEVIGVGQPEGGAAIAPEPESNPNPNPYSDRILASTSQQTSISGTCPGDGYVRDVLECNHLQPTAKRVERVQRSADWRQASRGGRRRVAALAHLILYFIPPFVIPFV